MLLRPWLRRTSAVLSAAAALSAIPRLSLAQAPSLVLELGGGVRLDMVLVRAGTFSQGSRPQEQGHADDEIGREVTLTHDYYIGKYPVTRGQFRRFVAESSYKTEAERGSSGGFGWDGTALVQRKDFNWQSPGFEQTDEHPVVLVTYDDASAFADWLTTRSGREVRLPTEAQWEHAIRAGSKTRYYGGDSPDVAGKIGWYLGNSGNATHPVGQKKPNELGLYDMAGNVWEWCRDFYGPYEPGPVTDPYVSLPPAGQDKPRRVLRGGSWLKDEKNLRSAARYRNAPGSRNADNGFRLIASTDVKLPPRAAVPGPAPSSAPAGTASGSGDSSRDAAFGLGFCACITLPVFGAIFGIVVFLMRRNRKKDVAWKAAADGFFFMAPPHMQGATVHYRVVSPAGAVPGNTILDGAPQGQFVYTGFMPTQVHIDRVNLPVRSSGGGSGGSGWGRSRRDYSFDNSDYTAGRHHGHSEPFGGHPSAY